MGLLSDPRRRRRILTGMHNELGNWVGAVSPLFTEMRIPATRGIDHPFPGTDEEHRRATAPPPEPMRRAASHSGDTVRLLHWNLRRCVDPVSGASSSARVLACIERLRPTLLTLNELDVSVEPKLLDDLAQLGYPHQSFFGHVRDGAYGNAILSQYPLTDIVHTHLNGGTVVRTKAGAEHRIARGLNVATVDVLGVSARVAVTHLDHMASAERTVQMQHILQSLGARPTQTTLLLGDLNALSRADYTDDEWGAHTAHNAAKGWAGPHDDASPPGSALHLLASASFVDCAALVAHRPYAAWPAPPWTAHARVAGPRYRIDYVWLRNPEAAGGGRRLVPLSSEVEPTADASDHQPLLVEVEAIAYDAGE